MRLALVRRRFDAYGGAELYLQRLLDALVATGRPPDLISSYWPQPPAGVRVHEVRLSGGRTRRWRQFAAGAARILEREQFDCVLSMERGLKTDVYRAGDGVHREWVRNWRRWGPWWKRPFAGLGAFHRALDRADEVTFNPANTRHIIVNSRMVEHEITRNFQFPEDRIHLVQNGVELSRFQSGNRDRLRREWNIPDDACLLFFAGSGWVRKGLSWLRRAFARLPQDRFCLAIAGKGHIPWNRKSNERFVGPLPRADMPDAYAAADLFTFPTLYDAGANSCAEALAAGIPVITTRQNGTADLVTEGVNGTVLDSPAETDALVAAIQHWAARRDQRPVPVTHDLTLERNVRETLAVLERAIAERRSH